MDKLLSMIRSKLAHRGASAAALKPRELWTASEWSRVRAPQRQRDTELSPRARQWLERLPAQVRPHTLCAHYPRIANQLAACWADVGLIEYLLECLLVDRRGGRDGFAVEIADEIAVLYEFHDLRVQSPRRAAGLVTSLQS